MARPGPRGAGTYDPARQGLQPDGKHNPHQILGAMANAMQNLTHSLGTTLHGLAPANAAESDRIDDAVRALNDMGLVSQMAMAHSDDGVGVAGRATRVPLCTNLHLPPRVGLPAETMPQPRDYRIADFSGAPNEKGNSKVDCLDWLRKVMNLARGRQMTAPFVLQLIERHTTGGASTVVGEAAREDPDSLEGVVRALEMRYGSLRFPEQAEMMCHTLVRQPKESITQLGSRIRAHAYMASRQKPDAVHQEMLLSRSTLLRVIPFYVRTDIEYKERMSALQGAAQLTFGELLVETENTETRMKAAETAHLAQAGRQHSRVNWVGEQVGPDPTNEAQTLAELQGQLGAHEGDSSVAPTAAEATILQVLQTFVKQAGAGERMGRTKSPADTNPRQRQRSRSFGGGGRRGRTPDRDRDREQGRRRSNSRDDRRKSSDRAPEGPGAILLVPSGAQTPGGTPQFYRQIQISTLNVSPNECAKCGTEGHRMNADTCPFKGQRLTEKCTKCEKGGHKPDVCFRMTKQGSPTKNN